MFGPRKETPIAVTSDWIGKDARYYAILVLWDEGPLAMLQNACRLQQACWDEKTCLWREVKERYSAERKRTSDLPKTVIQTVVYNCLPNDHSHHTASCQRKIEEYAYSLMISRHVGVGSYMIWFDTQLPNLLLLKHISHLLVPLTRLNEVPSLLVSEKTIAHVKQQLLEKQNQDMRYCCFPACEEDQVCFM